MADKLHRLGVGMYIYMHLMYSYYSIVQIIKDYNTFLILNIPPQLEHKCYLCPTCSKYNRLYLLFTSIVIMVGVKDLCQADFKSFSMQWSLLLPTNDVLQPRYGQSVLPPFMNSNLYYDLSLHLTLFYCFLTIYS